LPFVVLNLYIHNIKYINCDYTCRKKIFEKNYCDIETFPSIIILLNYKIIHYYVLLLEVMFGSLLGSMVLVTFEYIILYALPIPIHV